MAVLLKDSLTQKSEREGTRKLYLSKTSAVPEFMGTDNWPT